MLLDSDSGYVLENSMEIVVELTIKNILGSEFDAFTVDDSLPSDVTLVVEGTNFFANKGVRF